MSWPDWTGETVAIIASGPSTRQADVDQLRGRMRVLAIKKNVELAPWADAVYGCDYAWWKHVKGLPKFRGLKVSYVAKGCDEFGLMRAVISDHYRDELLFDQVGVIGAGGNSGFQALNLAVQFGASRVLLLGFDCQETNRLHWYGRNTWERAANPNESAFRRWRAAFDRAADQLKARDVEVVNASDYTGVKSFRKATVESILSEWGLSEAAAA